MAKEFLIRTGYGLFIGMNCLGFLEKNFPYPNASHNPLLAIVVNIFSCKTTAKHWFRQERNRCDGNATPCNCRSAGQGYGDQHGRAAGFTSGLPYDSFWEKNVTRTKLIRRWGGHGGSIGWRLRV